MRLFRILTPYFFQAESQFQLACPLLMKSISPETATQLNEKSFTELDKLFFSARTVKTCQDNN